MKKFFVTAISFMMVFSAVSAQAQDQKALQKQQNKIEKLTDKELNERASKSAIKEAKSLAKEGWVVSPGALPLDKQLDRSYHMQMEWEDIDGTVVNKYIMAEAMSIGENYDAGKTQALELAKQNLAGQISTDVTALVENTVANKQLSAEQAASVVETVSASKNLISQKLGRVVPVVECYRVKDNKNKEVLVRLAYNQKQAYAAAKAVVQQELEKKGINLHDQLDQVLGFK